MSLNASHLSTMFHAGFCQNPSSKPVMPAWSRFKKGWVGQTKWLNHVEVMPHLILDLYWIFQTKKPKKTTNQTKPNEPTQASERTNKQKRGSETAGGTGYLPALHVTGHLEKDHKTTPENQWLEDEPSLGIPYFQRLMLVSGVHILGSMKT